MLKKRTGMFLAASLTLLFLGCAHQIPSYTPGSQSATFLKGGVAKLKLVLQPSAFSDDGSLTCRLVDPVFLPNGQSFGQYIMDALQQELKAAELNDQATGKEFTVYPKRVDFSSALGATNWFLDVEYGNGREKFVISTVYNDRSSYEGSKACGNMALYFRKAVSAHLRQLYEHPTFRSVAGLPASDSPTSSGNPSDVATRLRQLEALKKDGLITKEEYDIRRQRVLDGL